MVLVKVGKLVIEENRRAHVLRDGELENALIAANYSAIVKSDIDVGFFGPLRLYAGVGVLKSCADSTPWHIRKAFGEIRGVVDALRVVKF